MEGPAAILDIDETGVTASFQSRTFKVARYWVRKRAKESDVTDEEWQTSLHRGVPWVDTAAGGGGLAHAPSAGPNDNIDMGGEDKPTDCGEQSTTEPGGPVMATPRLIPVPDSPPHSARDPPGQPPADSGHTSVSFNRHCAPSQAPVLDRGDCDHPAHNQLHG